MTSNEGANSDLNFDLRIDTMGSLNAAIEGYRQSGTLVDAAAENLASQTISRLQDHLGGAAFAAKSRLTRTLLEARAKA